HSSHSSATLVLVAARPPELLLRFRRSARHFAPRDHQEPEPVPCFPRTAWPYLPPSAADQEPSHPPHSLPLCQSPRQDDRAILLPDLCPRLWPEPAGPGGSAAVPGHAECACTRAPAVRCA